MLCAHRLLSFSICAFAPRRQSLHAHFPDFLNHASFGLSCGNAVAGCGINHIEEAVNAFALPSVGDRGPG